ncbi:MAG: sigma-70 family RNA polymerase sigma factor [bacterium]|nr:sigma-70 family RNA polymerase sigma factor [bacterium]
MSESSLPLVTQAKGQNRAAAEALLVRHLPGLHGWVRLRMGALLRKRETEEDLVQSVAREVLDDLTEFEWRGEAAFRHWLYMKAQRKLIDKARHTGAARRSPAREESLHARSAVLSLAGDLISPSAAAIGQEEVERIQAAFEELPPDYQDAISMQRLCGLNFQEIAERMGRSPGAVRNLVYRGLSRLALRIAELRRESADG